MMQKRMISNFSKAFFLKIKSSKALSLLLLICLTGFTTLSAQKYADCNKARDICDKKTLRFDRVEGAGADDEEANLINCFMNGDNAGQAEENCAWIKFEIEEGGSLAFTITPLNESDDIDFVVFKLPASGDCNSKQIVRCMASGAQPFELGQSKCLGQTGLRSGETDSSEDAGCGDPGDNTWLAPLKTVKGEKYAILISNVTQAGPGFKVSFSGSAKLPCEVEKPPVVAEKPAEKPPVVTEKPQEKPQPVKPVPSPAIGLPKYTTVPSTVGSRNMKVKDTKTVKNRKLIIKVWDSQVEDGDVISMYLNNAKILDHYYLRLKPHQFEIELSPDSDDAYLTIEANEFGKAEINTATIEIDDGVSKQITKLMSDYTKNESVRIMLR
jgi:hypothetical protein